jgi:type I restriction enzyme S subunit
VELKQGYKQTEVGLIPEDWEVRRVREVVTRGPKNGYSGRSSKDGAGTPTLSLAATSSSRLVLNSQTVKYLEEHVSLDSGLFLDPGDILVQRSNTADLVGTTAIFTGPPATFIYPDLMMRLKFKDRVAANWFWRYANSTAGRRFFTVVAAGSTGTMPKISGAKLREMPMPSPPFREQEAVADALSDADALIESLEQLIAKKRHLKQGAQHELLSGAKRLPGFSGKWGVKSFADLAEPRKERIDPRKTGTHDFCIELEHIEQRSGRLAGSGDAREGSSIKSVFQRGDVLFGKLRAYLRKYWLADRSGVCSTEIWVLVARPGQATPEFLFQLVTVDRFIQVASTAYGTHMPRSDWNVVKNYEVALPCTEEQTAIAAILSDMDTEIAALETKLAKARQIKQGTMYNLLTGRIRLV